MTLYNKYLSPKLHRDTQIFMVCDTVYVIVTYYSVNSVIFNAFRNFAASLIDFFYNRSVNNIWFHQLKFTFYNGLHLHKNGLENILSAALSLYINFNLFPALCRHILLYWYIFT